MQRAGLVLLVLLAGCAGKPVEQAAAPVPAAGAGSCNAAAAQPYVGREVSAEIIEAARVAAGAVIARKLTPDMMVTMEYRADRLSLNADMKGVVVSVVCG